ncbi:MAG TPA: hypothetical protein VFK80_08755, partial [Limnochordia bacterium]|nr:hypothetical protein [Limnochordia bacterium]
MAVKPYAVEVLQDGSWIDLTDRVVDITIEEDKESATTQADITLTLETDGNSLSPLVSASRYNVGSVLLAPNKQVRIYAADVDPEIVTDADLYPVFHGLLGPSIKVTTTDDEKGLSLTALDYASRRLSRYFLTDATGLTPGNLADIAQALCDLAAGAGTFTVYTPVSLTATVTQNGLDNLCQDTNAWLALKAMCEASGLDCRYQYVASVGNWRIVIQTPSTDMNSPAYAYQGDEAWANSIEITDDYVRNSVEVQYRDTNGDRQIVTAKNQSTGDYSIDSYGESKVSITEADTSIIDTATEAQALADQILADLKGLFATCELTVPFNSGVQIFDVVAVTDDDASDLTQTFAVDRVTRKMADDGWSTTLEMSGAVALRRNRWLEMHGGEGIKRPFRQGDYREGSILQDHVGDEQIDTLQLAPNAVSVSGAGSGGGN